MSRSKKRRMRFWIITFQEDSTHWFCYVRIVGDASDAVNHLKKSDKLSGRHLFVSYVKELTHREYNNLKDNN